MPKRAATPQSREDRDLAAKGEGVHYAGYLIAATIAGMIAFGIVCFGMSIYLTFKGIR